MSMWMQKRMEKAYPSLYADTDIYQGLVQTEQKAAEQGITFAKGVCLDKLIWVFLISSLLGCGIEMVFVRIMGGTWMRRSGVVFGPFSIVWGIGAVLLTISLYRFAEKGKIHIFLGGFFLGGAYEYMASVVLEALFHTRFWDYSTMVLNIGGRTNVLYMLGWGILSLVWILGLYPLMSRFIEKFPPFIGKLVTWTLMGCMCLDLVLSAAVLIRYTERKADSAPNTFLGSYLDTYYDDEQVEWIWQNLVLSEESEQ